MLSDEQEIKNLLFRYMEATDAADVRGRSQLFEYAVVRFPEPVGEVRGVDALMELFGGRQRLYGGVPSTAHLCTNVIIEIDEDRRSARARSRYTVFQQTPEFPLQAIIVGRYHDRFERAPSGWRFSEREFIVDLLGDMTAHEPSDAT